MANQNSFFPVILREKLKFQIPRANIMCMIFFYLPNLNRTATWPRALCNLSGEKNHKKEKNRPNTLRRKQIMCSLIDIHQDETETL